MKSRIGKWGNSLAVRIPKEFAADTGLMNDTAVELTVVEGKLVVAAVEKKGVDLRQLLKRVTRQNLHREIDFGPPRGREVW